MRPWCRPRLGDHPRSRGDGVRMAAASDEALGSPPLARGRPLGQDGRPLEDRITPARAGTAKARTSARRVMTDHPRSRGDGPEDDASAAVGAGSPPLARGRPRRASRRARPDGITPARAGTAPPTSPAAHGAVDHPRSRGDGGPGRRLPQLDEGSPPLARGRLFCGDAKNTGVGITPARAGTARRRPPRRRRPRDHPRSRGDGHDTDPPEGTVTGSPPLARGRRPRRPGHESDLGITPARAGTAGATGGAGGTGGDHPRSRGDGLVRTCSP